MRRQTGGPPEFFSYPSETLCLRGRSGAGKSTVVNAIMGLLPALGARPGGQIFYRDTDLSLLLPGS